MQNFQISSNYGLEWKRMPSPSVDYGDVSTSFKLHEHFIKDALKVHENEIIWKDYDIFYVVSSASVAKNLHNSCGWRPDPGLSRLFNFLNFHRTRFDFRVQGSEARGDLWARCLHPRLESSMPRNGTYFWLARFVLIWKTLSSR